LSKRNKGSAVGAREQTKKAQLDTGPLPTTTAAKVQYSWTDNKNSNGKLLHLFKREAYWR